MGTRLHPPGAADVTHAALTASGSAITRDARLRLRIDRAIDLAKPGGPMTLLLAALAITVLLATTRKSAPRRPVATGMSPKAALTVLVQLLAVVTLGAALSAQGPVPSTMPFQGRLTLQAGGNAAGVMPMTFRIYNVATLFSVADPSGELTIGLPATAPTFPIYFQCLSLTQSPSWSPGTFTNVVRL
jgi:hypothetical protein